MTKDKKTLPCKTCHFWSQKLADKAIDKSCGPVGCTNRKTLMMKGFENGRPITCSGYEEKSLATYMEEEDKRLNNEV